MSIGRKYSTTTKHLTFLENAPKVALTIVCDYAFFQNNGNQVEQVQTIVLDIWRIVSALYARDNIIIEIAELVIWRQPDNYIPLDAVASKSLFEANLNGNFSGDVALLLSNLLQNGLAYKGGSANIAGVCNKSEAVAFCNITTVYKELPFYSWAIYALAHELGHVLGAHHTHSCKWKGGPLDNCWCPEGDCSVGPMPPATGGSIMSYCQLNPSSGNDCNGLTDFNPGIDISSGFKEQPKQLIQKTILDCVSHTEGISTSISKQATDTYHIYPKLVDNQLHIDFPSYQGQLQISVFNTNGINLFTKSFTNETSIHLDTSTWIAGYYHLAIQTNKSKVWDKILIVH